MKKRRRFPIRIKILVALLIVVTGVVSAITFGMSSLFHEDKKAYLNEFASSIAIGTAEECRTILAGFRERLQAHARVIANPSLSHRAKAQLLESFFADFPDLVAVSVRSPEAELASVYNSAVLEAAGLTRDDAAGALFRDDVPVDSILAGEIDVRNSTLSPSLGTLTLITSPPPQREDEPRLVVSGLFRLDSLRRVAVRARDYEVFVATSDGTLLAHPLARRVVRRESVTLPEELTTLAGQYSTNLTTEYEDQGVEYVGGFAMVSFGGLVSGATIPKSAMYLSTNILTSKLLFLALMLLVVSTVAGLLWAHRLTRPVEMLSAATFNIAKGDFTTHVDIDSRDEIGELADSFNRMAFELQHRDQALMETQAQLVQSEKMAAFGQLGAGIAHEVKNPLAGILGCAQLSLRKVEKSSPLEKNLLLIEKETRRCKTIIENLLRFARQEKAAMEPIQLNRIVEDAAAIVGHQLEMNKVQLERKLMDDLPAIHGNANQLQQVLMNLMINAQQAMEGEPGSILVSTGLDESGMVEIRVSDTGPGISDEVKAKLFEPFFTTKPGGKGTGLGLSVSFGIIKDHSGEIRVESVPGEGATFVITLPTLHEVQTPPSMSEAAG